MIRVVDVAISFHSVLEPADLIHMPVDFPKKWQWFNPYTCGFPTEMSERIIRSNQYFKISGIYEGISRVCFKDKTTKKKDNA